MSSNSKRIIGHSGIYLLGSLMARAVSFIMLPIYTRNLTPSDYGVLELLTMTIDLVGLLLSMRVGQSIYRYYSKYDDSEDRKQVLFSAYSMTMVSSSIGMMCVFVFAEKLALLMFGSVALTGLIKLFSFSMLFQGLVETPMVMLRAQQKPWTYLTVSISKLFMQLSLNIYFVVYRQMHVEGVIYASLIAGGVMALFLGTYLVRNTGFSFSRNKAKEMMRFSLPFMAVGALSFYINFGDRYFLRMFGGGLTEVGIYSLGYKFGFLLIFIVGEPFTNVWDREKFRIFKENTDPSVVYRKIFLVYTSVLFLVVLGLSLFGRNAIMIMANKEYWKAAELIPVVCMAYVFNCMEGYANLGLLVKNRTRELSYGTIVAAVVVSAGYLFLIPRYGPMGAAWASLLAFGSRLVWNNFRARKYLDMKLDWVRVIALGVLVGVVWKVADAIQADSMIISVAINSVAIVIYVCALLYLPILPSDLRKSARNLIFDLKLSMASLKGLVGAR